MWRKFSLVPAHSDKYFNIDAKAILNERSQIIIN